METLFTKGQKVVCLWDAIKEYAERRFMPPLYMGKICTINDIKQCQCGQVMLDVGITIYDHLKERNGYMALECNKCRAAFKSEKAWWIVQEAFAPITYNTSAIEEVMTNFSPIKEISDTVIKQP